MQHLPPVSAGQAGGAGEQEGWDVSQQGWDELDLSLQGVERQSGKPAPVQQGSPVGVAAFCVCKAFSLIDAVKVLPAFRCVPITCSTALRMTSSHQNWGIFPSTATLVPAAGPDEHQQATGQVADRAAGRGTPQSAAGSSRTPLASPGHSTARPARPEQQAASSITERWQDAGPDNAAQPDQAMAGTTAEAKLAELQLQLAAAKHAQAELQDQVGSGGSNPQGPTHRAAASLAPVLGKPCKQGFEHCGSHATQLVMLPAGGVCCIATQRTRCATCIKVL